MIRYRCGRCAQAMTAVREQAGQPVACSRCGHVNQVPEPAPARPVAAARSTPGSPRSLLLGGTALVMIAIVVVWIVAAIRAMPAESAAGTPRSALESFQLELVRANLDSRGDAALNDRFRTINAMHFASALPDIQVVWEPRLREVNEHSRTPFTLYGVYGRVGRRAVILMNPVIRGDGAAIDRTLSHEMVHAQLAAAGDAASDHGEAFQTALARLAREGAFEGAPATPADRRSLRTWLDAESARLDDERAAMDRLHADLTRERREVEARISDLGARPDGRFSDAAALRDAYNARAAAANATLDRHRFSIEYFNREVERYNAMLTYPDGVDEEELVRPKSSTPLLGSR